MSTENDVPLGEGSRRYYEQQFGDRIRKVSKGGSPARGSGSGGSNWNGRAGIGIAVGVIVVILRIVLALSRSSSSTPSYTYTPPPQVKFDEDWQKKLDKRFGQPEKDDEQKRLNDLLQQIMDDKPAVQPPPDPAQLGENGLRDEEVPLPQGLCYRIQQESLRAIPTPGTRICQLLDDDARTLITKAAEGKALDEDEKDELLESLNDLLARKDLYEVAAFGKVMPLAPQVANMPIGRYNRQLLEKCYPKQIVPVRERALLNEPARRRWLDGARADLAEAQRLYEPKKR